MNLARRCPPTDAQKARFYELAAKRYKAEARMLRLTAIVHLENRNDEVFWGKVLRHACPEGRFRFISASRSVNGFMTAGCTQALKYRPFLDRTFWIAIDSDYRYLTEERGLDAAHYVLQTYTYSFENHFCYAPNAQRALGDACGLDERSYDFAAFLRQYSHTVYPLFVWQLYMQDIDPLAFPKNVFHRLLSLHIGSRSLEQDGASILDLLKERTRKMTHHFKRRYPDADLTWHEARAGALGLHRDNAYLYVRGHQLYDCITEQGRKLQNFVRRQEGNSTPKVSKKSFEQQLTAHLCFGQYDEIRRVEADVRSILAMPSPTDARRASAGGHAGATDATPTAHATTHTTAAHGSASAESKRPDFHKSGR